MMNSKPGSIESHTGKGAGKDTGKGAGKQQALTEANFADRLLVWFDRHGRKDLPWQQQMTPYRVWVSEIMLQQTQVATVIPYYGRFMARFPTLDALAAATEDEVLHQWTGLGYYARARNMHATSKRLVVEYQGNFPLDQETLETLPGIGRSTAAAIVAICTGARATILDGNVKRVLCRCFAIDGWPGTSATSKALWQKAEALTPMARLPDYTQAIMDLGSILCTRTSPNCPACPLSGDCIALATHSINQYPGKKPRRVLPVRTTVMLVIEKLAAPEQALLLHKRPGAGLWGGLWSFPECARDQVEPCLEQLLARHHLTLTKQSALPGFRHTFTHFHLDIQPLRISVTETVGQIAGQIAGQVAEPDGTCWYNQAEPARIGLTRPVSKILEMLS